jgi:ubiquinone/menaquinone biosynthesis C-methylase UbiE
MGIEDEVEELKQRVEALEQLVRTILFLNLELADNSFSLVVSSMTLRICSPTRQ